MSYKWQFLIFLLNLFYLCKCSSNDKYLYYSYVDGNNKIIINNTNRQFNPADVPQWTVQAYYNASQNLTGWDLLEIQTNPVLEDEDQVYHAGYMEGYITRQQIWNYYWNNIENIVSNKTAWINGKSKYEVISDYFNKNLQFISKMTSVEKNLKDPFWYQVMLLYKQLDGILDGYNKAVDDLKIPEQKFNLSQLMFLNFKDEAEDVLVAYLLDYGNSTAKAVQNKTKSAHKSVLEASGFDVGTHCSALIKVLPGNSDVFIAHDTWSGFNTMNRVLKRFKLPIGMAKAGNSKQLIPGMSVAFSSYPGVLASVDDFYVINSGLIVMETTNEIYNNTMYKEFVHPDGVVGEEIRNIVANRLATNGEEWMNYFARDNSGTYNNQWMIADLNKFTPGFDPTPGFLSILEQAPGKTIAGDQTDHILQYGFWSSYNIPFYPQMYQETGNSAAAKNNSWNSYSECPRCKIFKKEQSKVIDLDSMIWMMRYNYFETDPYSICPVCDPKPNACNSIASRCDLNKPDGNYTLMPAVSPNLFGATDTKLISYSLFAKGEMLAVGGPTSTNVTPFQWSKTLINASQVRHVGQPDLWNFGPIITNWLLPYQVQNPTEKTNDNPPTKTLNKNGATPSQPFSILVGLLTAIVISQHFKE